MGVKKSGRKGKKMKVIVLEEPLEKKVGALDYMGFKSAKSLKTGCCDAKLLSSQSRFVRDISDSDSSSGSCEADGFMIGCCIIHPL
jgi:hypothetical protein